jgi:DNA-directed RNA polymerase specialized sigma24 family protein
VPPQAVADVVQEIFIVIYRKLGSFEDRYSLQTWIAMVARRGPATTCESGAIVPSASRSRNEA